MSNRIIMLEDYGRPAARYKRKARTKKRGANRRTIRRPVSGRTYKRKQTVKQRTRDGLVLTPQQKLLGKCSAKCGGKGEYRTCVRTCMRDGLEGKRKG